MSTATLAETLTTMPEIEYGVPMPQSLIGRQYRPLADWGRMRVGASVFFPCDTDDRNRMQQTTLSNAQSWVKRFATNGAPIKFSTRRVDGGVRVWRIA